jgi:hypothetical protein
MTFDPATFLNQTYDEAMDTKIIPCPAGEYNGLASKVDVKAWSSKDGSSSGLKLVILWEIQDDNVKAITNRNPTIVKQEQMLDLTDTGNLDFSKGKNVGLGRIREALDLNTPGQPFGFSMIQGRMAKCNVTHRVDGPDIYDQVKSIAALS